MALVKKTKLTIALALSGQTLSKFARSIGVSPQAIDNTAREVNKSKRLQRVINQFITREFNKAKLSFGSNTLKRAA